VDHDLLDDALRRLQDRGVRFVFLHGSQASGDASETSDIDLAAFFQEPAPVAFELDLPTGVDLLVLNDAPLEIAGRIALDGVLVLDVDEVSRVRWQSRTRKVYADERYRIERSHAEFLAAVRHG
jgi:uncharacterized protein